MFTCIQVLHDAQNYHLWRLTDFTAIFPCLPLCFLIFLHSTTQQTEAERNSVPRKLFFQKRKHATKLHDNSALATTATTLPILHN